MLQVAGWLGDTASFGAKVPTVIFGPGGEPVYCPDEHLSVADIVEATQVYAAFARSPWPGADRMRVVLAKPAAGKKPDGSEGA